MGKQLGQYFLRSKSTLRKIASALPVESSILEIGPGKGALTQYLLEKNVPVVAIEKDPLLVEALKERFVDAISSHTLVIQTGDVRDIDWSTLVTTPYTVVANIPYYLTGSLIKNILECATPPKAMALVIQREVAERIVARDGKESLLSLSVRLFGTPKYITTILRAEFSPKPAVDSALLMVSDIHSPSQALRDIFFEIIQIAFHAKRKCVLKKFQTWPEVHALLLQHNVSEKERAESIQFFTWLAIAQAIASEE